MGSNREADVMDNIATYDACTVANWFIERARKDGRELTIMAILKLIYIAHGWHLEIYDKPLFHNRIEAWQFGPVVEDVYKRFRRQGKIVTRTVRTVGGEAIGSTQNDFLEQVYDTYAEMGAFQLSRLTHVADGPWDIIFRSNGSYAIIDDALIKQHYQLKRIKAERERMEAERAEEKQHG